MAYRSLIIIFSLITISIILKNIPKYNNDVERSFSPDIFAPQNFPQKNLKLKSYIPQFV